MSSPTTNTRPHVVLQIAGQRLRLHANTDDKNLERLAQVVTERYEAIQRTTRNAVPSTLLALVALDLADELQSARRKLDEAREDARKAVAAAETRAREIEQQAKRAVSEAIAEIDRALAEDEVAALKASSSSETG